MQFKEGDIVFFHYDSDSEMVDHGTIETVWGDGRVSIKANSWIALVWYSGIIGLAGDEELKADIVRKLRNEMSFKVQDGL